MATFVLQFRTDDTNTDRPLGDVIAVYETSDILEPPSPRSPFSFCYVNGVPDHQNKRSMHALLARKIEQEKWDKPTQCSAVFQYWDLPPPYAGELDDKEITLPFGLLLSHLYNRVTGRLMVAGDFD